MNQTQLLNPTLFNFRTENFSYNNLPIIISVSSAKGGVGKTSIVVNVSYILSNMGKRVLIFDADLGLSNVDVMLGLTPKYTIKDVINQQKSISDIIINTSENLSIIPASSGVSELQSLNHNEKITILDSLQDLIDDYDIIFIDNAAGIADNVIYFNLTAQIKLIVVTPEITSLVDAYSLIKILASQHDIKRFSIVVNQVKDNNEAKKIFRHLTAVSDKFLGPLSFTYLGHIPKDDSVTKSIYQQKTVVELFPKSNATRGYRDISQNIIKHIEIYENEFSLVYNNYM